MSNMQILILAAGESSRFWPFSEVSHKSLLKVGDKTILERVIDNIGKNDIILVVNPKTILPDTIKSRKNITVVNQEEPNGMDDAILKAKNLIKGDFIVIMPYYVNISEIIKKSTKTASPAIALKRYEEGDEKTHGIAKVVKDKIIEIKEKQKFDGAEYSILGFYKLNRDFIMKLNKRLRSENNFENLLDEIAKDEGLNYFVLDDVPSLKYVTDLLSIKDYIYNDIKRENPKQKIIPSKDVYIEESVILGKNIVIGNNVSIKGKTYIGDNSFIGDNSLVRDSILSENTEIGFGTEIARSIIMDNTHIHSGFIGDSVIGENCKLGANFITGNRRIDRETIKIKVKSEEYDTGLTRLGVIMGNNVKTGINTSIMPGTIIGNNSIVGSNTEVKGRIDSNKLVYSKKELIEKEL